MAALRFRKLRVSFAVGALLLLATAVYLQPAQAANSTIKVYTVSVAPTSVEAGSTTSYTFTITNDLSNTQQLGSANLTAASNPSGGFHFPAQTLARPTLDGTTTPIGSATLLSSTVIGLRGLSLQPGHSVTVGFSAEAPCPSGTYTWSQIVKQANDYNGSPGNNFNLKDSPAVTTVSDACQLAFSAQPASTGTGISNPITDNVFSTGGPVKVAVMSHPTVTFPSMLVTFSVARISITDPVTLQGNTPTDAHSGVASFSGLYINESAHSIVLHAAPDPSTFGIDAQGVDSTPFDVTDAFSSCSSKTKCGPVPDSDPLGTTDVNVTATVPLSAPPGTTLSGFLAVSLDVQFKTLTTCPGSDYVLPPTGGATFDMYQGSGDLRIDYTIRHPDRAASQFQMCYASKAFFHAITVSGDATGPNADGFYIGLLLPCKTAPAPCYQGYSTNVKTKAVTLTALLPPEGDRWTH